MVIDGNMRWLVTLRSTVGKHREMNAGTQAKHPAHV